jgi:hypothetical protein
MRTFTIHKQKPMTTKQIHALKMKAASLNIRILDAERRGENPVELRDKFTALCRLIDKEAAR